MTDRVMVEGLSVARVLYDFINREVLPGTGVPEAGLWIRLDRIVHDLAPRNRALLAKRDALQAQIDAWHRARKGNLSTLRRTGLFSARSDIWFRRGMTSPSTPRTWTTR
jgi:malate synthase